MFETLHLKEIGGETLGYRVVGSGEKTIVLVHGNMSSSQHFDLLAKGLSENFRVVLPDLRGFGGSSYNTPVNSLEDFADDVIALLKAIDVTKFQLLGWSTGGGIAMIMAAKWPEAVEKLYTLESVGTTGYPMFKKGEDFAPLLDQPLLEKADIALDPAQVVPVLEAIKNRDKGFYKALWNAAIYTAGNQPCEEHYDVYLEDMLTQRNLVDVDYALVHFNISARASVAGMGSGLVKAIQCPVVIFQGDKDIVVPMSMAEEIKADIAHAELHVIENCGHNPNIDRLDYLLENIQ